jgi:hypothetical protein
MGVFAFVAIAEQEHDEQKRVQAGDEHAQSPPSRLAKVMKAQANRPQNPQGNGHRDQELKQAGRVKARGNVPGKKVERQPNDKDKPESASSHSA